MATRTEPIRMLLCSWLRGDVLAPSAVVICLLRALASDELVEPPDLTLDRLEPVFLKFERVVVHALSRTGQRRAHALQAFLQPAAPAFEDAQPYIGTGLGEEGEVHAEPLVVPRRGSRFGQQVLQAFLTFGRQPVHDLRATGASRPRRRRLLVVFRDQSLPEELLETRIE